MLSLLLVIGTAFSLAAYWTIGVVSGSLFAETVTDHASGVSRLAVTLGEKLGTVTVDQFYEDLTEAARQMGGRLLVVDADDKVIYDTQNDRNGMMLPLGEVMSVLRGECETDYGYHQGLTSPWLASENESGEEWRSCFSAALLDSEGKTQAVLLSVVSIQSTVRKVLTLRDRMIMMFLIALAGVLLLTALIATLLMRPVKALSAGIERMGRGDYGHPVHVSGHGEMAELAAAFNEMSEKVHHLDETRNQFVSNASHELKTPLATMKILAESILYQDDMEPDIRKEFLSDINKEIDRLSTVVGDLLTLARIDSNKLVLKREPLLFRDVVRDAAERLRPLAEKHRHTLTVSAEAECAMEADSAKLLQVCYNLISNAIKYTPDGGEIRVTLTNTGRDAVLEVSDNGIGISKEDQEHVFERFYRADKARTRDAETGGTGLGLSIVRQIVRLHAGTVTVRSEPEKGTTFTVLLPCRQ